MAPRAYMTYYEAQVLSGHTSPYVEYAYFLKDYTLRKVKWADFIKKEIFFLKSTMYYSDNLLL